MFYIFPIPAIRVMSGILLKSESGGIGIIGGADGPTSIFISSPLNWYLITIIALELFFTMYLLLTRTKK